jgi:hypothetical protein
LPPLLALAGIVIALTQQKPQDIWIVVILFVVAAVYYFAYLHRAKQDRWVPHTVPEETL